MFSSLITILLISVASAADPRAPESFQVEFETDVPGNMILNITRKSAPLGVDRFYALVNDRFFDQAAFFRVVPNFVVQFGIAGKPSENVKWDQVIPDDPVIESNVLGSLTFATAGADTRTTELFINLKDNTNLDSQGFAPFGKVVSGMDVAQKIYNPTPGNSGGIDQGQYTNQGNAWLKKKYPKTNFITSAKVVNSTVGSLISVQFPDKCSICEKVISKATSIISKHGCGLVTRTLGLAACEAAGFGPEDPASDICAAIFEASCSLILDAIKKGTREPKRLCDLIHLC